MYRSRDEVEAILLEAIARIADGLDQYLLKVAASERSICHRLAVELEGGFPGYSVDCEFNHDGPDPKSDAQRDLDHLESAMAQINADNDPGSVLVVLDIVVHKSGSNSDNLLAIEVKKSNAVRGENGKLLASLDAEKLRIYGSRTG